LASCFLLGLLAIQPATAAITCPVNSSPLGQASSGQQITITYTKSSSSPTDGAQAGNVVLSFAGPDNFVASSKPYSFAALGSQVLTWTVRLPVAGTYTFVFNDTPTSGAECDSTLPGFVVNPYAVRDWIADITPGQGYDALKPTKAAIDVQGNIYLNMNQFDLCTSGVCGSGGPGSVFNQHWRTVALTSQGQLNWVVGPSCVDMQDCTGAELPDSAGRMLRLTCFKTGPAADDSYTFQSAMLQEASRGTGGVSGLNAAPAPGGCNDFATRAAGATDEEIYNFGVGNTLVLEKYNGALNTRSYQQAWIAGCEGNPIIDDGENGWFMNACGSTGADNVGAFVPSTGVQTLGPTLIVGGFTAAGGPAAGGPTSAGGYGTRIVHSQTTANRAWYLATDTVAGSMKYDQLDMVGTTITKTTEAAFALPNILRGDTSMPSTIGGFDVDQNDAHAFCADYTVAGDRRPALVFADAAHVIQGYVQSPSVGLNAHCFNVFLDPQGGAYVLTAASASPGENPGTCDVGPFNVRCYSHFYVEHYVAPPTSQTTPRFTPTPPTPENQAVIEVQAQAPVSTDCSFSSQGTTTADVGTGMRGFVIAMFGPSTGAQFLAGLILVAIIFLALAGAFQAIAKTQGVPALIAGSIGGIGIMIFNIASGIWEAWAGVVLIAIVAALVAWMLRRALFSGVGGGGDGQ